MSTKKLSIKKIKKILTKLAVGYYYIEEQIEYQKTQKSSKKDEKSNSKNKNISFFDFDDTDNPLSSDACDMMKIASYDKENFQDLQDDSFSKKKITTHYVPPDLSAIKMLLEIYGKEVGGDSISSLSDDELLNLKNKLIKELSNEN